MCFRFAFTLSPVTSLTSSFFCKHYVRTSQTGLLRAGYIPSKLTFRAMIDGMNLQTDMPYTSAAMRKSTQSQLSAGPGKFEFLMFVLDSLEGRKLTVDPAFYSSILVSAALSGGLKQRIASLF